METLPSESEIIRRIIHSLRRTQRSRYSTAATVYRPLWKRFSDVTGYGRGFSSAICRRYGFDPDETGMPQNAEPPMGPLV